MEEREPAGRARFADWFGALVAVLGVSYAGACVAGRLRSPWPLEWMEGASALHALRLLNGQALYAAPSSEHIPFVYPPLSYVPMALALQLAGAELWAARLPSVLALIASLLALARALQQLDAGRGAAWLGAGMFALGYGYTGGFLDLARVDALFMALSLWGLERSCARRHAAALSCCVLACFAKQHALFFLLAASSWAVLDRGRAALRSVLVAWAALGGGVLWLCHATDGWFWTYCVSVPARHGLDPRLLFSFLLVDVCVYLPVLLGLAIHARRRAPRGSPLMAAVLFALAGLVAAALGRAHPGGDDNVRLPAYALLCVLGAAGFSRASTGRAQGWLAALLVLQMAMLVQSPALYWPHPQHEAYFVRLRAELGRCAPDGDAVAMDHALLTGRPFVHTLALSDLRMNRDALAAQATRALLDTLRGQHAPSGIALSASFPELTQLLEARYTLCARVPPLHMPTGYALGATYVYARRP